MSTQGQQVTVGRGTWLGNAAGEGQPGRNGVERRTGQHRGWELDHLQGPFQPKPVILYSPV